MIDLKHYFTTMKSCIAEKQCKLGKALDIEALTNCKFSYNRKLNNKVTFIVPIPFSYQLLVHSIDTLALCHFNK
jgi:hypothetical protein